ncbi:cytochrome P450 [Streptomyces sp. NPDC020379]|uniref:cytochrome P450 n=1 Tax=Streptomyces sp. NPDC020379 TaxID=3365071 RepID=UPI0037ABB746
MKPTREAPRQAGPWTVTEAPGRLPLIGHTIPLRRMPLEFLTALPYRGDLVKVSLGRTPAYMACHPDLIGQVLADPRTFDRGGPFYEKTKLLMGNSLGNCPFRDHRRQRLLVQPSFRRGRLATYTEVMRRELEAEMDRWRPGGIIDVNDVFHALTARIGARVLLSTEIGTPAVEGILRHLPVVMEGMYERMVSPLGLLHRTPTPGNRRFDEALRRLRSIVDDIIATYRAAGTDHGDLLSGLLAARDEATGDRLSDAEIHDQVMNFLMASTETTATALTWTFHLLGENPGCEARLQELADSSPAGEPDGADRTAGHKDEPDYARRVITEVLRLYPPGWLVTRVVSEETELGGVRMPAGTVIIYSTYALQRDRRLFPDAERFDPDRWLPERAKDVPRGAMIPFGTGSRKCIGDEFAMNETTLAMTMVAARWRLRPVPGTVVRPEPRALVAVGPLPMVTEPRV